MARALALLTGAFAAFLLLCFPQVLVRSDGVADPWAAVCLIGAMITGLASGVGTPFERRWTRALLSPESCLLALTLATLRVAAH